MNEKPIYTQKCPERGNAKTRTMAFVVLTIAIIALLAIVSCLPYRGVLTVVVFAVGAYLIYKLLNNTVFDITYALYEDKLVFLRKYGRMEWENEVFPKDEATFYTDKIQHRGKNYDFYPDEKMKELLGV